MSASQPIIKPGTGRVVSVEALLRLHDDDGTLLAASDVFPALLDLKLPCRVSRGMLDQVVSGGADLLGLFS